MKKSIVFILLLLAICMVAKSQTTCDPNANLVIFTNYDGGVLNIDVDMNIPNLKIGVCTYEATTINLSGAYVGNVTEVIYAGYNGANNTSCGGNIVATTINGAPGTATTSILFAPSATVSNPNGYPSIICGYSCDNNTSQGGCNTVDQIEAYFLAQFPGSAIRLHKVQYNCWSGTQTVSGGGNCCATVVPNPIVVTPTGVQPTCFGSCNGTVSVSVTGGTPPYSYQWTGGPTSALWTGRCAGSYTMTVTDNASTTATTTFPLGQPGMITSMLNLDACDSFDFNGHILTASGVYFDTVTAFNGCDSMIMLHLDLTSIDTAVTQAGNVLTSAEIAAAYQWVNCDSNYHPVTGATVHTFTPTHSGNYAVIITKNGCTDTSACKNVVIAGIEGPVKVWGRLYPNPAGEAVTLEIRKELSGNRYTITDLTGRKVAMGVLSGLANRISLKHFSAGSYLFHIEGINEVLKLEKL